MRHKPIRVYKQEWKCHEEIDFSCIIAIGSIKKLPNFMCKNLVVLGETST